MQDTPTSRKPMRRMMTALLLGGMLLSALAGCSAEDDDRIIGVWHWPEQGVYENLDEDGQFGVFTNSDIVGDPYDWGTYTFDGETLTIHNAEGSVCSGATAVWTVWFSDDGTESHQTFVEDSCASVRGQDRVLIRQTP